MTADISKREVAQWATPDRNSIVARLSHMVHGKIGRDWRSGQSFILAEKGDEVAAIRDALALIHSHEATIIALIERVTKAEADNARLKSIIDSAAYDLSIWQDENYDCDCPPHRDCGCKKLSEIHSLLTRVTHDAALSHAKEGQR